MKQISLLLALLISLGATAQTQSDTLGYCADTAEADYNVAGCGSATWGIRIPGTLIPRHRQVQEVQFFSVDSGTYHMRIYAGQTPATVLHAENYTFDSAGWQTVIIADPLPVYDTAPLWITLTTDSLCTPTRRAPYSGNPDGSWMLDGDTWRPSHEVDGTHGTWMVRVILAEAEKVSLSLRSNNDSWGFCTGAGLYYPGDTVTIEAFVAHPRCYFDSWSDGCTDNPYTFVIESDLAITAFFVQGVDIDPAGASPVTVHLHGLSLAVDNPQQLPLRLYDIAGRPVATSNSHLSLTLPAAGVYILQADGQKARRIVAVSH